MYNFNEDAIREAAYYIWKNNGCPANSSLSDWDAAINQLACNAGCFLKAPKKASSVKLLVPNKSAKKVSPLQNVKSIILKPASALKSLAAATKKAAAKPAAKPAAKKTSAKPAAKKPVVKAAPKKTVAKKTTAKVAPKKTTTKTVVKKPVAKKVAPKKTTTKVVAKKATVKKAAPKKTVAKKSTTKKSK